MASDEARSDTTECRILKRMRDVLVDQHRWMKKRLFSGAAEGELQIEMWDAETCEYLLTDTWTGWRDSEFIPRDEMQVMLAGKVAADPETPGELMGQLYSASNIPERQGRGMTVTDVRVCLYGGVLFAAGQEGILDKEDATYRQVLVATARATLQVSRQKLGYQPLTSAELDDTVSYDKGGAYAQDIIIGFNDNFETTSDDIAAVIAAADVELACIREKEEIPSV